MMKQQTVEKNKSKGNGLKDWGILLATIFMICGGAYVLTTNVKTVHVNGSSMAPTYQDGDCLWMKTTGLEPITYERGDIVVVDSAELDQLIIKRIIGLPGDVVELKYEKLDSGLEVLEDVWVNGQRLEESYTPRIIDEWAAQERRFDVPEGHLFIMGDNRAHSYDSRALSNPYIDMETVMGQVKDQIPSLLCR